MRRTELLQEIRKMRFGEACGGWQERRLTQEEASDAGGCERTFRRYVDRYEEEGLDGLVDKCLGQVSARRAPVDEPVDEVVRTEALYRERYEGWNVKHFHSFYRREHGGRRSYTRVKRTTFGILHSRFHEAQLHAGEADASASRAGGEGAEGKRRRRRERAPLAGMCCTRACPRESGGRFDP